MPTLSKTKQRGSTLIMFTLMLSSVVVPTVGLGIDGTMLYIVQSKLSAAVDGAVLGAGRLLGSPADPAEIAGEFLRANFRADNTSGFWGARNMVPTVNVTLGTTKTIRVNATVDVPLLFSRIFGKATATVSAAATASKKDTRLMLVIDRSGSMNASNGAGGTVIADLKAYAQGFTQKFMGGSDEMGLVVFDGSAVVAYPTVRPWDPTVSAAATGGPNTAFVNGSSTDMVHQIRAITANSGTGIAEALWIAYIELQKAHLKDLLTYGVDDRASSIVLFTDGVPSAISMYLNNPANGNAGNVIRSTSSCTNKTITVEDTAHMMLSWLAIPGPPFSTGSGNPYGMYLLASTDPNSSHTASWWASHGGSDASTPNPTSPYANCDNLMANGPNTNLAGHLSSIPGQDRYGNSTTGNGYPNSHVVDSDGNVSSIYNGTSLDVTKVNRDYHWGLAIWNAVDDAAARIRADVNLPNRGGDVQNMAIQIFTIGYLGNAGNDDGLLKRIANDPASSTFNSNLPRGRYISASDSTGLANAFAQVASSVLRLSQ